MDEILRAAGKAARDMARIGAFGKETSLEVFKLLYEATVETAVTARAANLVMRKADWEKAQAIQNKLLRRWANTGTRASGRALLEETGLTSIQAKIVKAKLGLHERIRMIPKHHPTWAVQRARMEDVRGESNPKKKPEKESRKQNDRMDHERNPKETRTK